MIVSRFWVYFIVDRRMMTFIRYKMRVECIDAFYKDIYQKYSKKDAFVENG